MSVTVLGYCSDCGAKIESTCGTCYRCATLGKPSKPADVYVIPAQSPPSPWRSSRVREPELSASAIFALALTLAEAAYRRGVRDGIEQERRRKP